MRYFTHRTRPVTSPAQVPPVTPLSRGENSRLRSLSLCFMDMWGIPGKGLTMTPLIVLLLIISSCHKDASPDLPTDKGVYIVNEGLFNFGQGEISFYNPA